MKRPQMILFDYGHTLLYEPDWDAERGDRALLAYAVKNPKNCGVGEIRREVAEVFGEIERIQEAEGVSIPCILGDRLVYEHLGIEFSLTPHEQETVFWTAACLSTGRWRPRLVWRQALPYAVVVALDIAGIVLLSCA